MASAAPARVRLHTLANGVRLLALPQPHSPSACLSVFIRSGSRHENRRSNGISHVVEHMAFKGTATRSAQRINRDAESLGAEVNAHTDRDHTAFHMRGLADDMPALLRQLADIVLHGTYPDDELARERQVILHELTEVEDDPVATAFKLFDRCCHGQHPLAQPVIGTRANIQRFSGDELRRWVAQQYTGANTVVAVAAPLLRAADWRALCALVEDSFGAMPAGSVHPHDAPPWLGGYASRRQSGCSQVQLVLGLPLPPLQQPHAAALVAAALVGEGMSSPLMDELREQRGLLYYAACSADVLDGHGSWVIEASTSPEQLPELMDRLAELLREQARRPREADLARARRQLLVRLLSARERPFRQLEDAVQDLYALGRVRTLEERCTELQHVSLGQVRQTLRQALSATPALALAGRLGGRHSSPLRGDEVLQRFGA